MVLVRSVFQAQPRQPGEIAKLYIERNPSVSYRSGRTEFYTIEAEG
jgi:hypothetical protein